MIPQIDNKADKMEQIEKQEIANSTFKIHTDNLITIETPTELNTDASADLDKQLTRSNDPFSTMAISSIKRLFFDVGLEHVTNDQVQNFLNRLPRIEHLDFHQSTFEILRFLCDNPNFAKLIYQSQVLNFINYSTFETVEDQIKTSVSSIILKIIDADKSTINSFMNNFFPHFYNNLISSSFFADGGLATHLDLASKFIRVIDDQTQIETIFSKFTLFIHHTSHEVISSSIIGLLVSIKSHNWLLRNPEFSNEKFINRISFLASQKNEQTGSLIFILFQHLISSDYVYPDNVYLQICRLIISYMSVSEDVGRRHAITLIGFAFANAAFVRSVRATENESPFDELMKSFLDAFPTFKLNEKRESAYAFANFFGFLPSQAIDRYINNNNLFFNDLVEILEFDDPEVLNPLLNGLDRPLKVNPNLFTLEQKGILIEVINEIATSDDEVIAKNADYIRKELMT